MFKRPKIIPSSPGVHPVRGVLNYISLSGKQKNIKLFKQRWRHIPSSNGVYFFKDSRGNNLYIGKAANLHHRLGSYFQNKPQDSRVANMLAMATKVEWQETPSEIEALILESQLIKKNRPPFNIVLRDDKQYFYVVITKELFPKILVTHQPQGLPSDSASVATSAKEAALATACRHSWLQRWRKEGPFTDGIALRATLKLLRRVFPYCTCRQKHHHYCLNYHLGKCPGYCCLKNHGTKNMPHETTEYKKNIGAIKEILSGKKTVLIKQLNKKMRNAAKKENFSKAIVLRDKIARLERVFENARIIRAISDRADTLRALQNRLSLPHLPRRIEGYDISNMQGKLATGSMVVFTDGQPDPTAYRKFQVRSPTGDTHMLKEVLSRRFHHPEWSFPDLILVDGGKGQLNAAYGIISKKEIPVIALTKNSRHRGSHVFIYNRKEPVALEDLPPTVANLILAIDAEAHRFAISYYRHLHRATIKSN